MFEFCGHIAVVDFPPFALREGRRETPHSHTALLKTYVGEYSLNQINTTGIGWKQIQYKRQSNENKLWQWGIKKIEILIEFESIWRTIQIFTLVWIPWEQFYMSICCVYGLSVRTQIFFCTIVARSAGCDEKLEAEHLLGIIGEHLDGQRCGEIELFNGLVLSCRTGKVLQSVLRLENTKHITNNAMTINWYRKVQ